MVLGNAAEVYGGGIYCIDGSPTCFHSTISDNVAYVNGSAFFQEGAGNPEITNCILWDNASSNIANPGTEITFSDVRDGYWGTGNINADPKFVNPGQGIGSSFIMGDYHLQAGSPCINAGNNMAVYDYLDIDGKPRTIGDIIDMGAYEFQGTSPIETGILTIDTLSIKGQIFVDGEAWGIAPQSGEVEVGEHTVSFGDVAGYVTPADAQITVYKNQTTTVTRNYTEAIDLLVAWGSNSHGQCDVPSGDGFATVTTGYAHNLAVKFDGSIVSWGLNGDGQCDTPAGNDFAAVEAGLYHSLALKFDSSLVAWGLNDVAQCNTPEGNDYVAIATT